jgi:RimJ/RimL family protein N-acetyltransferase
MDGPVSDATERAVPIPGWAQPFVETASLGVHPLVASWYAADELRRNVAAWLADDVRLVEDLDAKRAVAAKCPVAGRTAEEYGNRVVRVAGDLEALAGIRFRTGDPSRAFVELVTTSRPVADAAEHRRTFDAVARDFAGFSPRSVRFHVVHEAALPVPREKSDLVLAARVDDLRALAAASSDAVLLRRVGATVAYDHYLNLYANFHAEAPRNAELARVEDVESLAAFEADGGLFEIRIDGFFAGYCAARRCARYGVRGWLAGEIILTRRFRGQGHASSVHRRMADAIPALPGDALWAQVHEDNVASWKAGLSAGYAVIGIEANVAIVA